MEVYNKIEKRLKIKFTEKSSNFISPFKVKKLPFTLSNRNPLTNTRILTYSNVHKQNNKDENTHRYAVRGWGDRGSESYIKFKSLHTCSWSETSKLSLVVLDKTSPKMWHYKKLLQEKVTILTILSHKSEQIIEILRI